MGQLLIQLVDLEARKTSDLNSSTTRSGLGVMIYHDVCIQAPNTCNHIRFQLTIQYVIAAMSAGAEDVAVLLMVLNVAVCCVKHQVSGCLHKKWSSTSDGKETSEPNEMVTIQFL